MDSKTLERLERKWIAITNLDPEYARPDDIENNDYCMFYPLSHIIKNGISFKKRDDGWYVGGLHYISNYLIKMSGQKELLDITTIKAKSLYEFLIELDLRGFLYDDPAIT